jgi:hypothetical protein
MPLFLFGFEILQCIQYMDSITFIKYIHPSPFAEVLLQFLIADQLRWDKLECRAENRTRACVTARRRTTN